MFETIQHNVISTYRVCSCKLKEQGDVIYQKKKEQSHNGLSYRWFFEPTRLLLLMLYVVISNSLCTDITKDVNRRVTRG